MPDLASKSFYGRYAARRIKTAVLDTPVVMVVGPRQCGKTTLVRTEFASRPYFTLDDQSVLASVRADPAGFVRELDFATIDEVQREPDLLRAIKRSVDDDRRAGRFLLTGSANILTLPTVAESLAGRMEVVTLLPLAQTEIRGTRSGFLEAVFAGKAPKTASNPLVGRELVEMALVGGYPEMIARATPARRSAWARDYIRAVLERDARDVADIEKLEQLPRLLRALAHHSGQLINFTQLAGQIGLDDKTARRYVGLLENLFLVRRIEPWFRNDLKRLVKTPKLHFLDSGLLAAVGGVTAERILGNRTLLGPLLETFVFGELLKLSTWSDTTLALHHYRDKDQDEVDVVLEDSGGAITAIEVKAAASVSSSDFKGLRKVAHAAGEAFRIGLVLYDGEKVLPFGDRLYAAPVSSLWAG